MWESIPHKWLVRGAWCLYALLCIWPLSYSIRFLTLFETGFARALALSILLPFASPLLVVALRPLGAGIGWRCGLAAAVNGLVFLGLAFSVPTGETSADSEVSEVFLSDYTHPRWELLNILPELEQMKMAQVYGRKMGVVRNRPELKWVEDDLLPIYRSMRERQDYIDLGSVTYYMMREGSGEPYETGHVYRFVPKVEPGRKLPVLIAIHGYGGNSKAFLRTWERFGAANEFIVLCPSFGLGIGQRANGDSYPDMVERVRQHALTDLPGDPDRVYLAGFSTGGRGACAAAYANPAAFKGMIFISPMINANALTDREFVAEWGQSPILCLTGAEDDWTSWTAIRTDARRLKAAGLNVRAIPIRDEGHSLFYAAPDKVFSEIQNWLAPLDR